MIVQSMEVDGEEGKKQEPIEADRRKLGKGSEIKEVEFRSDG